MTALSLHRMKEAVKFNIPGPLSNSCPNFRSEGPNVNRWFRQVAHHLVRGF
jgi:hypothetical protein